MEYILHNKTKCIVFYCFWSRQNCFILKNLLKIALNTDRKHRNVLALEGSLLNIASVYHFLILVQSTWTTVTQLQSGDQFFFQPLCVIRFRLQ